MHPQRPTAPLRSRSNAYATTPSLSTSTPTQPHSRRLSRRPALSMLLCWLILATSLPSAAQTTTGLGTPQVDALLPPKPVTHTVAPVIDPQLPSLIVQVAATPATLAVGTTAEVTVQVTNQSRTNAQQLEVWLPLPTSTKRLDRGRDGWKWQVPLLAAGSTVSFKASMQLVAQPEGQALLATASATARGLDLPVQAVGGALVAPPEAVTTSEVVPSQTAILRSAAQDVMVYFGTKTAPTRLTLTHRRTPPPGTPAPKALAGFKRGFGPFFLEAHDQHGKAVERFAAPLRIVTRYTPQQLQALGIAESDLSLFWFDPQANNGGQWVPIPSTVDVQSQTVQAEVDHFSAYQLGDGSSPSAAFIPSLEAWQVGLQTGSATLSYPLEVPSGPGGLKPSLQLTYSSAAHDGPGGLRPKQQASWVGRGWSLDLGGVARNKISIEPTQGIFIDTYSLIMNGQTLHLVRAEALAGNTGPDDPDPSHWSWRSTNETFARVQVISNGPSLADAAGTPVRGGMINGVWQPRHTWQIWTKEGTRYDFAEDLWYGWDNCDLSNRVEIEPYKWLLSSVSDVHGNTINYSYARLSQTRPQLNCDSWNYGRGVVDQDAWPTSITWGGNQIAGTPARYKVDFVSTTRSNDTAFDGADNQYGGVNGQPRETRLLQAIQIKSLPSSTWQLVRQYNFAFDYSLLSDQSIGTASNPSYPKLTLKQITMVGNDGTTAQPSTSFSYGTERGSATWPAGNWNRLTSINNGQGGIVSFSYAQVGQAVNKAVFQNYRRVVSRTLEDGQGGTATWTYSYGTPMLNSLGWQITGLNDPQATQQYPNSAALYYNKYLASNYKYEHWLLTRPLKEFRGHNYVKEIDPSGTQTEHWYYQGDVGCAPTATGNAILQDSCFLQLRDREVLKGKEYRTQILNPADRQSTLLQTIEHSFAVVFSDYTANPLTGLWRSWDYEAQTIDTLSEGTTQTQQKRTVYTYDPAAQGNMQYGNPTRVEEYANGDLVRATKRAYLAQNTTTSYVVDRVWQESIVERDPNTGVDRVLALTNYFYDQTSNARTLGTKGSLRRVTKYTNLPTPAPTSLVGLALQGIDTTFEYDQYGNQTAVTSYAAASTRTQTSTDLTWSSPGNGSAASTTSTTYDPVFNNFAVQTTPPTVNGVSLIEQAAYDYRMGTLTAVSNANDSPTNNTTVLAEYDLFGRLVKVIKPGDSATYPTMQAYYYDWAQPFRYTVCNREQSNQSGCRSTSKFYNGRGQLIQQKAESSEGTQTTVVDNIYNGVGQLVQQSQPRFVAETSASFFAYTPLNVEASQWAINSYDGLGRPIEQVTPDGATLSYGYWASNMSSLDANGHRSEQIADALGRRVAVKESAAEPQAWQANTPIHGHSLGTGQGSTWVSPNVTASHTNVGFLTYGPYQAPLATGPGQIVRFQLAIDLVPTTSDQAVARIDVHDATSGTILAQRTLTQQEFRRGGLNAFRDFALTFDTTGRAGHSLEYRVYWLDWAKLAHAGTTVSWSRDLATTTYRYDALDLFIGVTDAMGNQTQMRYDSVGRKLGMTDPDMGTWSYSYDVAGNLISQTDAKGQTMGFAYDALERLISKTYPGGGQITYGYDAGINGKGQRTSMSKPNATTQWSYDQRGRVISDTSSVPEMTGSRSFVHTYNSADQLVTLTYPDGETVRYSYNAAGEATSLCSTNLTPNVCYVNQASYTPLAQMQSMSFGNGIQQTRQFDLLSQRVSSNFLDHGTTGVYGRTYSYDLAGNVETIGRRNSAETEHFRYDQRDRLIHAWTTDAPNPYDETYTYNSIGNLLSKDGATFTYPTSPTSARPHAVSSRLNEAPYTYDANGNLLTGRGRTLVWNADNQPTSITGQDGVTETYRYDGDGQRSTRIRNSVMTVYVGNLWEEDLQTSSSRALYAFNGQTVAQRTKQGSTNTLIYLHGDHLGSASLITAANGQVLSRQDYTPFGELRPSPATNPSYTTINYTGQRRDDTGLLFYNARYYDPELGRFISADSIVPGASGDSVGPDSKARITSLTVDFHEPGFASSASGETSAIQDQGFWFQLDTQAREQTGYPWGPASSEVFNRYAYALNNPLAYTDPTGHQACIPDTKRGDVGVCDEITLSPDQAFALNSLLAKIMYEIEDGASVWSVLDAALGLAPLPFVANFIKAIIDGLTSSANTKRALTILNRLVSDFLTIWKQDPTTELRFTFGQRAPGRHQDFFVNVHYRNKSNRSWTVLGSVESINLADQNRLRKLVQAAKKPVSGGGSRSRQRKNY